MLNRTSKESFLFNFHWIQQYTELCHNFLTSYHLCFGDILKKKLNVPTKHLRCPPFFVVWTKRNFKCKRVLQYSGNLILQKIMNMSWVQLLQKWVLKGFFVFEKGTNIIFVKLSVKSIFCFVCLKDGLLFV